MRHRIIVLFAAVGAAALLAGSAAHAGGGYDYDGYVFDGYRYGGRDWGYGWYQPGPVTDGYYGRPRFFRGWHDRVAGYDDLWNYSSYYPYGSAGYLPDSTCPYLENRGYGVQGRGWQLP